MTLALPCRGFAADSVMLDQCNEGLMATPNQKS